MKYNIHTHILDHTNILSDTLVNKNEKLIHFNHSKDDSKIPKYRTRTIKLDNILATYHNHHFNHKTTVQRPIV